MSITAVFVADPPQYLRSKLLDDGGYVFQLGDRLSAVNAANDSIDTYEVTTGGVSGGGGFTPAGATPYVYGGSTWTKVTANSWATAAHIIDPYRHNYIDADGELVYATPLTMVQPAAFYMGSVVAVDRATMQPRVSRYGINNQGSFPIHSFFLPSGQGGFHGRVAFGYPTPVGSALWASNLTPMIDCDILDTGGNAVVRPNRMRGGRVSAPNASVLTIGDSERWVYPSAGMAVTISAPAATSVSMPLPDETAHPAEADRLFGVHIAHNVGAAALAAPSYESDQGWLSKPPTAYISENAYASMPWARGMQSAVSRSLTTYRDGAAPASDDDQSLLWGGQQNLFYSALRVSPWLYIHNKLTGARTLTFHFLTDSPFDKELSNLDVWLECFYPSSATTAKYSLATTENANWGCPAAVPAVLTADAATWTYTGIFFPTAWKLVLSFSPQRVGMLFVRIQAASVRLGRHVVYLCPYVDIA